MRRSRHVTLTLATAGLAALSLSGCGKDPVPQDTLFQGIWSCVEAFGPGSLDNCAAMFADARRAHARDAPRYGSREECNLATGGGCTPLAAEPSPDGSPWFGSAASSFIPIMAGVLVGRALSDGSRSALPVYSGLSPQSRPCPPDPQERASRPDCRPGGGGGSAFFYSGQGARGGTFVGSGTPRVADRRHNEGVRGGTFVGSDTRSRQAVQGFVPSPSGSARIADAPVSGRGVSLSPPSSSVSRAGGLGVSGAARGGGVSS